MNQARPRDVAEARALVDGLLAAGLRAADPRRKVAEILGSEPDLVGGIRPTVIAVGKAATSMAAGVRDALGDRMGPGIILTKDGHASEPPDGFIVFEADHPVPDQRGLDATRTIIETVTGLKPDDLVLTLISGGGSALLELPRHPLTLADLQATTSLLLLAGAPIEHLNAVRGELSQVKGGGLRRRIGKARSTTLILSDVLGNDPEVIASGPTVSRQPDPERALSVLHEYDLVSRVPPPVLAALGQASSRSKGETGGAGHDEFRILADNDLFIEAIVAEARRRELRPRVAWRRQEGEARELGRSFVGQLSGSGEDIDIVIGGGEATVTVRGEGSGGRNTEFTLAAGLELLKTTGGDRWAVASVASDGQDGSIDGAGAITSAKGIRAARQAGLDPEGALLDNDSGGYFDRTGELIRTGPTGTNVNDVSLGLRLAT